MELPHKFLGAAPTPPGVEIDLKLKTEKEKTDENIATMVAAVVSVAAASFATSIVDTFESTTDPWTGDGALSTVTPTEPPTGYGYPISDAAHAQVLAVSGTVTRDTTGVSNANVFDMMVKVARPDETPGDFNSNNPQFAIYSDTNGDLKLYCKETSDGSATSVTLGNFEDGAWLRLTVAVDYSKSSLVVATNGVLTASTYYLANTPQSQSAGVTNVNVIGTTAIDDFVAKSGTFEPYAQVVSSGNAATTDGLPAAYMSKYSKSSASETVGGGSSLTVAQAYAAGVAPVEGARFAIEEASYDGNNLTLTFPGDWPAGSYTVKYGATASCTETATNTTATKTGSGNQVTIPLNFESGNVLYYKVAR